MGIFVVASAKGKSGKTTIAMHVSEFLRAQGRTLFIDTAINQGGFEWAKLNAKHFDFEHINLQSSDAHTLEQRLKTQAKYFDFIVVDIDGQDSKALRSALMHADKLIIPISTQLEDIELHDELLEVAIGVVQYNTKLKVYTVLNRVPEDLNIESLQASQQQLLSELPSAHFLNTVIYEDEAYREARQNGISIWEQSTKASTQFDALMFELLKTDHA